MLFGKGLLLLCVLDPSHGAGELAQASVDYGASLMTKEVDQPAVRLDHVVPEWLKHCCQKLSKARTAWGERGCKKLREISKEITKPPYAGMVETIRETTQPSQVV